MTKKLYILSTVVLILAAVMAALMLWLQANQFTAEINDTVSKIPSTTFNLIVYTDVHHDREQIDPVDAYIPTLDNVSQVLKRAKIDTVWNLGDIINGFHTTKEEGMAEIRDVTSYEDKVSSNIHRIMGNHDNNIQATYYGLPETEVLSAGEVNELLRNDHTNQEEHRSSLHPTDYYVDFDQLRVICISADVTTFLPETSTWLKETALHTELPVLILSHIPTRPEWGFHNDVVGGEMIEETLREFIIAGGEVIAFIHGHDHGDMISTVTDENGRALLHEVCVACSRFHVPLGNGTPGMTFWERKEDDATMLIFDVVSVDLENRKVQFTRFGAGEDRVIEY